MTTINDKNAHPRDALIEFEVGPHKYTCQGEGDYRSVTTWLHTHFKEFDADAIIKKMNLTNPRSKYYGKMPEEIKAGWEKDRDEAAAAGTAMHAAIEEYYMGGSSPWGVSTPHAPRLGVNAYVNLSGHQNHGEVNTPFGENADINELNHASALCVRPSADGGVRGVLTPQFTDFVRDHSHLKPYRTEWMIFDEDVRLAGSIDFVTENPDGTLTIYDWKRCKEIKKTNSFGEFAITDCIAHLPDTNYWHYALQLNTYKTILERKYAKKVTGLFLVGLHPNLPSYQMYTVPFLVQEMADLFAGLLRLGC
jgi:hypothetical protein